MFLLVLMVPVFGWAQNANIKKGWEQFAKNEYKLAESSFKKALTSAEKEDALIGLIFASEAQGKYDQTSQYIMEFNLVAENPEPYLEAMWQMGGNKNSDEAIEHMKKVAASSKGKVAANAYQELGRIYRYTNRFKESAEAYAQTGAVQEWQLLGEFENISESGFDKDFGAVAHPEASWNFKNHAGADVNWFTISSPGYRNWIDFTKYFVASDAVMYAQNFCKSPKDQEVQFRIGTSGSVKVWVNDQLMFSEPEERNNGLDTYIFTVKLMKGYNRFLIQIGSSEISSSNFLVRITDTDGTPVEGLTYSTRAQNYPKDYRFDSKVIPWQSVVYFQKKIAENPEDFSNYLLLNNLYGNNQMTFDAKKNLKAAKVRFPDCSYLTLQLLFSHNQDNNDTEASKCLEEIKTKDPDFRLAMNVLFDEALDREDYKEAESILDKIAKMEPDSKDVFSKKMTIANKKEEVEELVGLIREAYKLYPEHFEFVMLRAVVALKVENSVSGAVKIYKKYLKKFYDMDAMESLIGIYEDLGKVDKIIAMYNKIIENNPVDDGTYYSLYQIYFSTGNYQMALKCIDECLKIAPYYSSYYAAKGEAYAELKENLKAKENLELAIHYDPQDYDARHKLRVVQGSADIFESFEKIDVYDVFKKSPGPSEYPEDNSIVLLDVVQKVVYPGGGSQEKHILVAKVLNNAGIDTWKEHSIPLYRNQRGNIEKMEVLKKNGSKIEATNSGTELSFPNLEVGDAIHITWKVSDHYSGILANHFWGSHYLTYFVPVLTSSYSLLIPKDKAFNFKVMNSDITPTITDKENNKLYVWKSTNNKAVKDEPYMPVLSDVGPMLFFSSIEDWNTIAGWYADLAYAKAKVDFEVKEVVDALFEGKTGLTDEQKVKEIYTYIQDNIRYSSVPFIQSALIPQKASKVLSRKQGDCKDVSTLFVAMCKSQNIPANLVLVNTRDEGVNNMPLPGIGFNHCIAKINLNSKDYYVELTDNHLPFGSGLSSVKKVFVLEIPSDKNTRSTAGIIDPASRITNIIIRKGTVTFEDDLMKVQRINKRTGIFASSTRNTYKDLGEEKQMKELQESITDEYPKIKLTSLKFDGSLQDNSDTLYFTYNFEVPNIFTEVGNMLIVDLPWTDKFVSPVFLSTDERKFPIELWAYMSGESYLEELNITIPAGKKLSEVPKNLSYSCKNATYSLEYKKVGNQLNITRKFVITNDVVMPADYEDFKKFIANVVKADKKQVAFTLP